MTNTPSQKYAVALNSSYVAGKGRFGANGLQLSSIGAQAAVNFPGNPVTTISIFAIQIAALGSGPIQIWHADDGATVQCSLGWLASGQLQFYRGSTSGTAVGSPSTQSFPPNSIIQIQIKCTIDPTNGLLECRLNGNTTAIMSFTGNTRSTANSYASRLSLGNPGTSQTSWYSDIILFDNGGSAPNDYLGNKAVYTLVPNADSATAGLNQFQTQPAQSTGSHYLNINAEPPNTANYNFSGTSGQRESYRTAGMPANVNNISVANVWAYMEIDNPTPHTAAITARSNGVDSIGPAINVAQSYTYYNQPFSTDPNTGAAWLNTAVSSAEWGLEVLS